MAILKKDNNILCTTSIYRESSSLTPSPTSTRYNLGVTVNIGYGGRFQLTINGTLAMDSLKSNLGATFFTEYENVENFMWDPIEGFWEEGSWDWASLTMGESIIQLTPRQTYTLTQDATLVINNYSCLTGDTLVTMSDRTQKRIDEIELGDIVLSIDSETNKLVSDKIIFTDKDEIKTEDYYDLYKFSNGYSVKTVKRHRFYNIEKQKFVYMDEWNLGEHTYTINGEKIELLSHERINETVRHYKITTEKNHNYFANGMLTGSRLTPDIKLN